MPIILSAIPFTSTSHSALNSAFVRIVDAIRAPLMGGLEYIGRMIIFNCDSTAFASSGVSHTTVNAPTLSPINKAHKDKMAMTLVSHSGNYWPFNITSNFCEAIIKCG